MLQIEIAHKYAFLENYKNSCNILLNRKLSRLLLSVVTNRARAGNSSSMRGSASVLRAKAVCVNFFQQPTNFWQLRSGKECVRMSKRPLGTQTDTPESGEQ